MSIEVPFLSLYIEYRRLCSCFARRTREALKNAGERRKSDASKDVLQ
jgi:hypothetical protein